MLVYTTDKAHTLEWKQDQSNTLPKKFDHIDHEGKKLHEEVKKALNRGKRVTWDEYIESNKMPHERTPKPYFCGSKIPDKGIVANEDRFVMPQREEFKFTDDFIEPDLLVYLLVDCSGSMKNSYYETLSAMNEYIDGLKNKDENILLSIVKFDSRVSIVKDLQHISLISSVTDKEYVIGDITALNDAIGTAIKMSQEDSEALESHFGSKQPVLIVTFTDGNENASKMFTHKQVGEMREECVASDMYTFVFVGSDVKAKKDLSYYGIDKGNTIRYDGNNTTQTMDCLTSSTEYLTRSIRENSTTSVSDFATNKSVIGLYNCANAAVGEEAF